MDKWENMRHGLSLLTVKELKRIAKDEGICLGYDACRKESIVRAIVSHRRYVELSC